MTRAEQIKRNETIANMRRHGVMIKDIAKHFGLSTVRIAQILGDVTVEIDEACVDCLYFRNNFCYYGKECDFKDEFESET